MVGEADLRHRLIGIEYSPDAPGIRGAVQPVDARLPFQYYRLQILHWDRLDARLAEGRVKPGYGGRRVGQFEDLSHTPSRARMTLRPNESCHSEPPSESR
jgi:hypothetical protein